MSSGGQTYRCKWMIDGKQCEFTTTNPASMGGHSRGIHRNKVGHTKINAVKPKKRVYNIKKHSNIICKQLLDNGTQCGRSFDNIRGFKHHSNSHKKTVNVCHVLKEDGTQCGRLFDSKNALGVHQRNNPHATKKDNIVKLDEHIISRNGIKYLTFNGKSHPLFSRCFGTKYNKFRIKNRSAFFPAATQNQPWCDITPDIPIKFDKKMKIAVAEGDEKRHRHRKNDCIRRNLMNLINCNTGNDPYEWQIMESRVGWTNGKEILYNVWEGAIKEFDEDLEWFHRTSKVEFVTLCCEQKVLSLVNYYGDYTVEYIKRDKNRLYHEYDRIIWKLRTTISSASYQLFVQDFLDFAPIHQENGPSMRSWNDAITINVLPSMMNAYVGFSSISITKEIIWNQLVFHYNISRDIANTIDYDELISNVRGDVTYTSSGDIPWNILEEAARTAIKYERLMFLSPFLDGVRSNALKKWMNEQEYDTDSIAMDMDDISNSNIALLLQKVDPDGTRMTYLKKQWFKNEYKDSSEWFGDKTFAGKTVLDIYQLENYHHWVDVRGVVRHAVNKNVSIGDIQWMIEFNTLLSQRCTSCNRYKPCDAMDCVYCGFGVVQFKALSLLSSKEFERRKNIIFCHQEIFWDKERGYTPHPSADDDNGDDVGQCDLSLLSTQEFESKLSNIADINDTVEVIEEKEIKHVHNNKIECLFDVEWIYDVEKDEFKRVQDDEDGDDEDGDDEDGDDEDVDDIMDH